MTGKSKKSEKVTPLMKQYYAVKSQHPDAILLFRVGDFYETFDEDATTASGILGIVLTNRNNGGSQIPLAGFPHHSLELYLPKLVKAGYRVAICEQLEKPSKEKKIVKRGVTDIVSPGVVLNDQLLSHKFNNYLAAIHFSSKNDHGIALLDISTGEFIVSEGDDSHIEKIIQSFTPSEILINKNGQSSFDKLSIKDPYIYYIPEWVFQYDTAIELLKETFQVANLKGFGVDQMQQGQIASGVILHHLKTSEKTNLPHLVKLSPLLDDEFMWLNRFTIQNLELIQSLHAGGKSLLEVIDHTITSMGARMLRKWTVLPLKNVMRIKKRQDVVTYLLKNQEEREFIIRELKQIGDLERVLSKIALNRINPRELKQLQHTIEASQRLKNYLQNVNNESIRELVDQINPCMHLTQLLEKSIADEPPVQLHKGNAIKTGYDEKLDSLRDTIANAKTLLLALQTKEIEATGINNLKIGFNNVFGYYLEVTNKYKNQGLVPDHWVRKQTLANAERYITEELKILETKILEAQDGTEELESQLFASIVLSAREYIKPLQHNAIQISQIDCLQSFAELAGKENYTLPIVDESFVIEIKEGRHPVIESQMPIEQSYIPNDLYLENDEQQIIMITGPNMSGKSAILRQSALITILAQMGSYVPASYARIGIVDKLFTRVGASDNISSGESTFMVEMNETANIINNFSKRSLILLDEIGRGTSTFDGISIAWSLAEYLHNSDERPKTLFATHYHELNELGNNLDRIKNYNVSTKEIKNKVIFLRKLVPGGSNHSFGIHVAKMAGMPTEIVERSMTLLNHLKDKHIESDQNTSEKLQSIPKQNEGIQLSLFEEKDLKAEELRKKLLDVDINAMTPVEAMMFLNECIQSAKDS